MNKKLLMIATSAALIAALQACTTSQLNLAKVPKRGAHLPYNVLQTNQGADASSFEIRNGGFGSAATRHPSNPNQFYALTDRGPNATFNGDDGKGKMFPTPDYTPRIGLFEIESDGSVRLVKDILLKDTKGHNITGLPNSSALGGTGETPYDAQGRTIKDYGKIKTDDFGLDGEGLVALKDGSFWVSDEYGPHMVHFDASGKEIDRINAFAKDARTSINLPAEYAMRRANRGMEGLAITPDEKKLIGIMQSTMYLPSKKVKDLDITRIVVVDLETHAIEQYLYRQEKTQNSNSEIVALTNDSLLIIERDGSFFKGGPKKANPKAQKQVYKITLSSGTNLEAVKPSAVLVQDEKLGLTIEGKTLEQTVLEGGWAELELNGIRPVEKSLVVDMVKELGYPHDKMEGLIVFNDSTLGVLNDDDFATWSTKGKLHAKFIDAQQQTIDSNTLYIIDGLDLK